MLSSVSWLQPPEEYWKHLAQQVAAPPAQLAAVQYAFRPLVVVVVDINSLSISIEKRSKKNRNEKIKMKMKK